MSGVAALLLAASLNAPVSLQATGSDALMPALVRAVEGAGRRVVDAAPLVVTLTEESSTRVLVEARLGNERAQAFVEVGHSQPFERARTLALHCLALAQEVETRLPQRRRSRPRKTPRRDPPASQEEPAVEPSVSRSPVVFAGVAAMSRTVAPSSILEAITPAAGIPLHALSVEPHLLEPVAPDWVREHYPMRARVEGVESTVVLELQLDATGAVSDALLLEESRPGYGFAAAARTLARRLRFSPAILGRMAVPTRIVVTIRFEVP